MESGHESNTKEFLEPLIALLSNDNTVQNLIEEFNVHAPHFRINKIAKITNSNRAQSLNYIEAVSSVVHLYISHNQNFEQEITTTFLPIQDKLRSFISSLNENGKKGLQMLYLAETQHRSEPHGIQYINDELFLKVVYDNGKPSGLFPLVKFEIAKNDNQATKDSDYFLCPVHVLKNLSEIFDRVYHETTTQIKEYKNQLSGGVVLYED